MSTKRPIKGRGATSNPENRFDKLHYELDESENRRPETTFFNDHSTSIITYT